MSEAQSKRATATPEVRAARRRKQNADAARRSRERRKMSAAATVDASTRNEDRIRRLELCVAFLTAVARRKGVVLPASGAGASHAAPRIARPQDKLKEQAQPKAYQETKTLVKVRRPMAPPGALLVRSKAGVSKPSAPYARAHKWLSRYKKKESELPDGEKVFDQMLSIISRRKRNFAECDKEHKT